MLISKQWVLVVALTFGEIVGSGRRLLHRMVITLSKVVVGMPIVTIVAAKSQM